MAKRVLGVTGSFARRRGSVSPGENDSSPDDGHCQTGTFHSEALVMKSSQPAGPAAGLLVEPGKAGKEAGRVRAG
jgi:hypothetical protein